MPCGTAEDNGLQLKRQIASLGLGASIVRRQTGSHAPYRSRDLQNFPSFFVSNCHCTDQGAAKTYEYYIPYGSERKQHAKMVTSRPSAKGRMRPAGLLGSLQIVRRSHSHTTRERNRWVRSAIVKGLSGSAETVPLLFSARASTTCAVQWPQQRKQVVFGCFQTL